ncbi:response regulator [Aquipuribacter nitratireducens]|uniref:Response regulator transcription factor n=1 Tax=Aquipuribacter nitratireducens TaxID=650104 RepID=A0ABW0GLY5_9MICO
MVGESVRPRRVLVVDDHTTFAELLVLALEREPDLECVGHAATVEAGIDLVDRTRPDVVVMDVRLPDGTGFAATRRILELAPGTTVVVLTAHASPDFVAQAAGAGATAFLPKGGSLAVLLDTVREARPGRLLVHPSLVARARSAAHDGGVYTDLTQREAEVLELMGQGHDVTRIARRLGMSENTCRGHVKAILVKLDAHTQLEAVVKAVRRGLLSLDGG